MASRKEPKRTAAEAERLHAQARRCFRLARSITDEAIARDLDAMGREFEQKALDIERGIQTKKRDASDS